MRARRAALAAVLLVAMGGAACARPRSAPRANDELGVRWEWLAPSPSSVGMPAADAHGVAATFGHRGLVFLSPAGTVHWQIERDRLRDVAPALAPDVVVAGTEDAVVAFDRVTGAERWSAPLAGERPTTPVLTPDLAVVLTWEGHAVGIDRDDGRQRWRVALPGGAIAAPAADATTVVAVWEEPGAAGVIALDARTGATRWSRPLVSGGVSGPALVGAGGRPAAVLVAGDRAVHAFDLADGTDRWSTASPGGAGSAEVPPVVDGADLVVADRLTGLARVTARGQRRWGIAGPGAAVRGGPVALPGGMVALPVDEGGLLVSFDGRRPRLYATDGRVSGIARSGALLLVATREGERNALTALHPVSRT